MVDLSVERGAARRARGIQRSTHEIFVLDYYEESSESDAAAPGRELSYSEVISILPAPNSRAEGSNFLLLAARQEPKPTAQSAEEITEWEAAGFGFELTRVLLDSVPRELARYLVEKPPEHLTLSGSNGKRRQLLVIVSTLSGTGEAEAFFRHILEPVLLSLGIPNKQDNGGEGFILVQTTTERSVTETVERSVMQAANLGTSQTILLCSGDGGVVDTINAIKRSRRSDHYVKPAIALMALGTGNALANSCGLNDDATRGLSSIMRGAPHRLPTFQARFSPGSKLLLNEGRDSEDLPTQDQHGVGTLYGAIVASWALHASLVADSDTTEYRKFGDKRFSLAAQELLAPSDGSAPHLYNGKMTLFKQNDTGQAFPVHWTREIHMYILATFVSKLEKTFTISPHSKPLDGKLRLLHFGGLPSGEVGEILGRAFQGGKHIHMAPVGYESIEGFRIDFQEPDARWRRVCVDGKIVQVEEAGWMEVRKDTEEVVDLVVNVQGTKP